MKPLRICYFSPVFLPDVGGAEYVTAELARGFHHAGHHVHVLTRGKPVPLNEPYRVTWYPKMRWPHWRPERVIKHLRQLHVQEAFDVFLVNYGRPTGIAAVRLSAQTGIPTVLVSHGGDLYRDGEDRRRPHVFARTQEAYQRADTCVAISPYLRTLIQEIRGDTLPTADIPNGIHADPFTQPATQPTQRPESLPKNMALTTPFALCLGNLTRYQGFDDAIKAFAQRGPAAQHLHLHVVGTGEMKTQLNALVAQHKIKDRVHFWGRLTGNDKHWLMQHCQFGLMPSTEEGHPIVGLELLAAGRPLICSTNGAFDALVEHGVNGWRVPARDVDSLAQAITHAAQLTHTQSKSMSVACQTKVKTFAWPHIVQRYLDLLQQVVSKSTS